SDSAPKHAVGAEISAGLVDDCRKRLGHIAGLEFVETGELDGPRHRGRYEGLFCMEVLEHVVDVVPVITQMHALLAPGGTLVLSVPVETGPPVILKQMARRIAGWRGVGDYPGTQPYTLREFAASMFPGPRQHVVRPIHRDENGSEFHDHKGFNWVLLKQRIAERFEIERVLSSPIRWLPPHLGSQVWFIARPAPAPAPP
ncbi:MAG: class I SAM-dependent methyltransferase, partial [Gemmatimonadales bacterium]